VHANLLKSVLDFVHNTIKRLANMLVNHRYHWDDLLFIVRPFVYVYSVMMYGRKSYIPIKISFAIDLVIIVLLV
jgi:hypothetical protein